MVGNVHGLARYVSFDTNQLKAFPWGVLELLSSVGDVTFDRNLLRYSSLVVPTRQLPVGSGVGCEDGPLGTLVGVGRLEGPVGSFVGMGLEDGPVGSLVDGISVCAVVGYADTVGNGLTVGVTAVGATVPAGGNVPGATGAAVLGVTVCAVVGSADTVG
jgi:hypothetical protein